MQWKTVVVTNSGGENWSKKVIAGKNSCLLVSLRKFAYGLFVR